MTSISLSHALLQSGAERYGLSIDLSRLSLLERYFHILSEWNARMNLVSSRDMDRFVEYHLLDSLKIASCFDFSTVRTLLDFGSGSGLPGIPLAIAFPHIQVTLLDSREKRWRFLSGAVNCLHGQNLTPVRSRIEELPHSLDSSFDVVTTRATVSLAEFYLLASRFLSPGGSLISIKGNSIEKEFSLLLSTVDSRLFNIHRVTPVPVPGVRSGQVVMITNNQVINRSNHREGAL